MNILRRWTSGEFFGHFHVVYFDNYFYMIILFVQLYLAYFSGRVIEWWTGLLLLVLMFRCYLLTHSLTPLGSINKYQQNLGVNGHTMQCTGPVSMVLQLWLESSWELQKWSSVAAPWTLEAREVFNFFTLFIFLQCRACLAHFATIIETQVWSMQSLSC